MSNFVSTSTIVTQPSDEDSNDFVFMVEWFAAYVVGDVKVGYIVHFLGGLKLC